MQTKWEDIQREYPNQYAFITNVKKQGGEIVSCDLLQICSKEDKVKWLKFYLNQNIKFDCERTTFNAPNVGALL